MLYRPHNALIQSTILDFKLIFLLKVWMASSFSRYLIPYALLKIFKNFYLIISVDLFHDDIKKCTEFHPPEKKFPLDLFLLINTL